MNDNKGIKKIKTKKKLWKRVLKGIFILIITICVLAVAMAGYIYSKYGEKIASTIKDGNTISQNIKDTDFNTRKPTQFYDINGKLLKEFKTNTYYYTKEKDLNPYVGKAFTSIEDERFYEHDGVDYKGIARSAWVYIKSKGGTLQGGSTITQQLSRNVFLTLDRNMWRKLSEAVIAQNLEKRYSKSEILEFYVNNINYGNGCYSIESASQYYFQKSNKDLSISQIAMLVVIPNNPSIYDPVNKMGNVTKRRNLVLDKMLLLGKISQKDYTKAKTEVIKLNIKPNVIAEPMDYSMQYAVHNATLTLMEQGGFIFRYSFSENKDRITYFDKYNEEYSNKEKELLSGRYRIDTSIDMNKQQKLQIVLDKQLSKYTKKDKNTGLYEKQGASVTIDNSTGEVVAIVGGRSQTGNTFNRGFLGVRQPGSSIKPLVAYTPAYENGYIPSSNGVTGITLRHAVEASVNPVAVSLVDRVGVQKSLQYLQNMEFKYITPDDKTSIVALGGFTKGVTAVEMASGFSTLARNGTFIRPTNVRKITNTVSKEIVYESKYQQTKIYDSGSAYLMTDTLKGVLTEKHGTGKKLPLSNYKYSAGKTGTTNKSKDCWFVGYTPYYSTSVWVGNDIPAEQNMYGADEPGHIWKEYMEFLHKGLKEKDFIKPNTIINRNGVLMNTLYVERQQEANRKNDEYNRIRKENNNQIARLNREDYRIKYGLSEEQELGYEKFAKLAIEVLESYILVDKTQYEQLEQLIQSTSEALQNVKHQDIYFQLQRRLQDKISKLNNDKFNIDNPPVVIEPVVVVEPEPVTEPVTEPVIVPEPVVTPEPDIIDTPTVPEANVDALKPVTETTPNKDIKE